MKKVLLLLLVLAIGWGIGRAQTPSAPFSFSVSAAHTGCPAATPGVSQYCFATDGIWESLNGGTSVRVDVQAATPITINSKTGTNFTIGATSTAPAITASSSTPTVTVTVQ